MKKLDLKREAAISTAILQVRLCRSTTMPGEVLSAEAALTPFQKGRNRREGPNRRALRLPEESSTVAPPRNTPKGRNTRVAVVPEVTATDTRRKKRKDDDPEATNRRERDIDREAARAIAMSRNPASIATNIEDTDFYGFFLVKSD